jgi:hypothetical protein
LSCRWLKAETMPPVAAKGRPFVDREEQLKLFNQLVTCANSLRVMVISQQAEFGKSELLRKLRRQIEPPLAVSLVTADPEKKEGVQDPMRFVFRVCTDLEAVGMKFPKTIVQASNILPKPVLVNLENSRWEGAKDVKITGVEGNAPQLLPLTPDQQLVVLETFYSTFFDELDDHSRNGTVVILIDAFEKWKPESDIYEWFHARFLKRLFFGGPQPIAHLLLIVAGKTMPTFDDFSDRLVESRVTTSQLEPWTSEHSIEYFRLVMQRDPRQDEIDLFERMALMSLPPGLVASTVDAIRARELGK